MKSLQPWVADILNWSRHFEPKPQWIWQSVELVLHCCTGQYCHSLGMILLEWPDGNGFSTAPDFHLCESRVLEIKQMKLPTVHTDGGNPHHLVLFRGGGRRGGASPLSPVFTLSLRLPLFVGFDKSMKPRTFNNSKSAFLFCYRSMYLPEPVKPTMVVEILFCGYCDNNADIYRGFSCNL